MRLRRPRVYVRHASVRQLLSDAAGHRVHGAVRERPVRHGVRQRGVPLRQLRVRAGLASRRHAARLQPDVRRLLPQALRERPLRRRLQHAGVRLGRARLSGGRGRGREAGVGTRGARHHLPRAAGAVPRGQDAVPARHRPPAARRRARHEGRRRQRDGLQVAGGRAGEEGGYRQSIRVSV